MTLCSRGCSTGIPHSSGYRAGTSKVQGRLWWSPDNQASSLPWSSQSAGSVSVLCDPPLPSLRSQDQYLGWPLDGIVNLD